jgi:hypothetical protein
MIRVVEIETSGGVFENKIRAPRIALRLTVSPAFQKGKFGPQDLENVTIVRLRETPKIIVRRRRERSVTRLTKCRDKYHRHMRGAKVSRSHK